MRQHGRSSASAALCILPISPNFRSCSTFFCARQRISAAGLPDPVQAARRPDGLCGLARDLSVTTLMEAYARGLYPKAYAGPLKWWAPAERMVVDPGNAETPEAVRGHLQPPRPGVTFDRDFDAVVAACAKAEETFWRPCWMSPKVKHAYAALHDAGFAHCFEVRDTDGKLVAGGFGVAVGRVFVCESTFGKVRHWRDLGLTVLNRHLALWGFAMHDAKTQVIDGFGFAPIARETYQERLAHLARRRAARSLARRSDPLRAGAARRAGRGIPPRAAAWSTAAMI